MSIFTNPRVVIALGGNALGNTPEEQENKINGVVPFLADLISEGYEIIITHGNGPQVGMIQNAFGSDMPLAECSAMSQGYIGFHLQKAIHGELRRRKLPWHVATVVTQVAVDPKDPAFARPSKPIGPFFTEKQAEEQIKRYPDAVFMDDAGRGWRRAVASPKPIGILEKDPILRLLENNTVVIACGGGGIPVVPRGIDRYESVDAVIDKDLTAARLAEEVDAEYLFILTAVDHVVLDHGTERETPLTTMTTEEARYYMERGEFAPGSMGPKIEAAVTFAESKAGRIAVIGSPEKAAAAMRGESGTRITVTDTGIERYRIPGDDPRAKIWLYR